MEYRTDFQQRPSGNEIRAHYTRNVTLQEQIAYMTKFYPTPKFMEMNFDETEASSNQSENSHNSIADSSSSGQKIYVRQESPRQRGSLEQQEMSEIKAKNFGITFNGKRPKQDIRKSAFDTEFDYEQLLGELSFQDKIQEKVHFSAQKDFRRWDDFDLEEKDKSFTSQKKQNKKDMEETEKTATAKVNFAQERSTNKLRISKHKQNYKWDPPSEVLFKRQNQLKWIFHVLSNRELKILEEGMNKIKVDALRKPCQKSQESMKKDEACEICSKYMSIQSSMIEESWIGLQKGEIKINL